jgi:hypothetical protein
LELAQRGFNLLLLNDALNHLSFTLDAIEGNAARCTRQKTKNPEWTARDVARGSFSSDNLTDFEHVLRHGTLPKEPKDRPIIRQPVRLSECCHS